MATQNQSIQTYARIKPISPGQQKVFSKKNVCTIVSKNRDEYAFDRVFDAESTNQEVYNETTRKIIQQTFQGFNSCVLTYGQTSSGKTYTMKGTQEHQGLIPLCLKDIFNKIRNQELAAEVVIAYIQIYNQNIIDLLSDNQNQIVQARQDQKKNLNLIGLRQFKVNSIIEAMQLFEKGEERRKFASNSINVNSSRSHVIFKIKFRICDEELNQISSQINMVDLAGSQGIDKTKNEKLSKYEGQNINKSILALTRVIKTMSQKDQQWINFRDSKLTRILQKSLCENSKSTIICMINPTKQNFQQSLNTLKFGQCAGKIKIESRQNIIRSQHINKQQSYYSRLELLPSEKIELEQARMKIKSYEEEINKFRKQNKELEQSNYMKEESIGILERKCQLTSREFEDIKSNYQEQLMEWWREKQSLKNAVEYYREEVEKLGKMNEELQDEKRVLQKNQKSLVENLHYYQNQCRHLNTQILSIKAKIDEENSKTHKTALFSQKKPNPTKNKSNIFQIPPYKQSCQRLSPAKLSWIVQLKVQVIELGRRVNEFTKANIQIVQENEQLRKKIDQLQEKEANQRASGKVNPEALEYNQIKKLNNKIKNLKKELKNSQDRQRKNRQILKKESNRNLIEMEEFEEWYTKKYNSDCLVENFAQTASFEQLQLFIQKKKSSVYSKNMEIEMSQKQTKISETPSNLFKNIQKNFTNYSGIILSKNKPYAQNQNPQINNKAREKNQLFFLDQQKLSPAKSLDLSIQGSNNSIQLPRGTLFSNETSLLDDINSSHVVLTFSNQSKRGIQFQKPLRQKKDQKIQEKQKLFTSVSNIQQIQKSAYLQDQNSPEKMILEEEKDLEI